MNGQNALTQEEFLGAIENNQRKHELASLILGGSSFEELQEKGYGRIPALEMLKRISIEIQECEDVEIGGESVLAEPVQGLENGSDESLIPGTVLKNEEGTEATVLENGNLEIEGEEVPVVEAPETKTLGEVIEEEKAAALLASDNPLAKEGEEGFIPAAPIEPQA